MYEKIDTCPSCQSKELTNYIICDDYSVSQESFAIMQCKNCELLLTSPRPDQQSIGKYYQSKDYISHTNQANNLTNSIYKIARSFSLRRKFKLVDRLAEKNTILDYGCGTGEFLGLFQEAGWNTYGVEPDDKARQIAIEDKKLEVHPDIIALPKKKFGIITLWHVLEHVHDLDGTLKELKDKLSKKGKLIIAVPNHDSYDRKFYKKYWAAYDVPRHLYHFNQLTIKNLLQYYKFKLIETKPMKLDAYYVSLLSEQHKKSKIKYIKAVLIGWLSNRWAKKNNQNYSSIIYIFEKA